MENWKQYIVAGNQAFQQGDNLVAITCYQQASTRARQQLGHWYDTQAVLSALVLSDLKVAEVQCRLERFEEAIDTYSTLSLELRRFQCCFAPSNPITSIVTQALNSVKQEFINLTKVYAYDILYASKRSPV
ncbi:hypothetical protein MAQ5080_01293 [Marinomonas aquimarina]|uniref:Tetratricopeptide repeat protein n=1 Tax=Marinomonas aquimarina TaxID=295068 RepID=A0A1A8TBX1_9GAMM|nr:tetratricopeptide repeat protein [Marinomonas aquimarina]SBS29111.1 hypothetical protein MAQ5080_01293 [Marinomonas aquimarina]